jgi:hypothetical protein
MFGVVAAFFLTSAEFFLMKETAALMASFFF